jgi:hypothetical protein
MSSSPINGRFCFVAAPAASIAPKPNPANSGASEVSLAWNAAKDTKSRAVLEAFIKQYGDSFYATLARARLDEIKNAPLAPPQISSPAASVALPTFINANRQRAVLYEEDPDDAKGKQYVGTVVWRTEPVKAAGKPTETSVRADIEIPDRKFKMTLSFRRNTDPSLPASHTADLTFILPPDFAGGGVSNVPGILMKSKEQARGMPLAGLAVKVTEGFFLVGLSKCR